MITDYVISLSFTISRCGPVDTIPMIIRDEPFEFHLRSCKAELLELV